MSSTPGPVPPSATSDAPSDAVPTVPSGATSGAASVGGDVPAADVPAAQAAPAPAPVADEVELPAGAEVEASGVEVTGVVDAALVRHAPRYRAFLWAGAVVGFVVGGVAGFSVLSDPGAGGIDKPGVLFTVILVGGIALGLLVAGFVAVLADRRSLRRRR